MELAIKSRVLPSLTSEEQTPRKAASALERAYRDMLARRAKEQHEFRIQRSNITNPVLNMLVL